MKLNPYHFLLLKHLILLESAIHNRKAKGTYKDVRIYIEDLKPEYSGRSNVAYGEYVIRRIFRKRDFSFKEGTLDELCQLLVSTVRFGSWKEFCIAHENHFSEVCAMFTYVPYSQLKEDEKEKIDLFVSDTISLYKHKD